MCLAVYLACDKSLPTTKWDESAPSFYLEAVPEGEPVTRRFQFQHVYYAGSHEGCGCGFSKDGRDDGELQLCQANYDQLGEALSRASKTGARLQLFTCWEGEQSREPILVGAMRVTQLTDHGFELQQLHLLDIEGDV
jgi:hypothetical protein